MSEVKKNMDCQDIKAMLSALVDDRVDEATRHDAERHLAGCLSCRKLLDEAEAIDDLIVRDAAGFGKGGNGVSALPPGFAATVLERATIVRPTLKRSFVTWTGWTAAAACLVLAIMIWSFDRQAWMRSGDTGIAMGPNTTGPVNAGVNRAADGLVQHASYERRSWTFDGDFSVENQKNSNDEASVTTTLDKVKPATIDPAYAAGANTSVKTNAGDVANAAAALAEVKSNLTIDDAQTLYSVSLVMETLENADLNNFAEVDRIRRIAEYDNLLPRLEDMRSRLSANERPVVVAAECILLRIVRGPVTQEDAKILAGDASGLRLAKHLETMSERYSKNTSL